MRVLVVALVQKKVKDWKQAIINNPRATYWLTPYFMLVWACHLSGARSSSSEIPAELKHLDLLLAFSLSGRKWRNALYTGFVPPPELI